MRILTREVCLLLPKEERKEGIEERRKLPLTVVLVLEWFRYKIREIDKVQSIISFTTKFYEFCL